MNESTSKIINTLTFIGILTMVFFSVLNWEEQKYTNVILEKTFDYQLSINSPKETVWRNTALCTDNMLCQYVEKGNAFAIDCTRDADLVTKYCATTNEQAQKLGIIKVQNGNVTEGAQ